MKKLRVYALVAFTAILFNGCWFTLGSDVGLCEGEGCDYSKAGVCKDVIYVYKNRHSLKNHIVEE